MRRLVPLLMLAAASIGWGKAVGVLDDSRMLNPGYNIASGWDVSMLRAAWEARGATWEQTSQITPQFLSGVSIFVVGLIKNVNFGTDEQDALVDWVKAGGRLVIIADCS
jgi:hypothetical protein